VALIGTALVLLNTGMDELGNPRLRDASTVAKIGGRRLHPADPTPVLLAAGPPPPRSWLAGLAHSFSRSALLEERGLTARPGGER
jgi:hypothetical protein